MQSACRSVCADATLARIRKATLCVSGCRTVEDLLVLVWASCLPDTKIELDGLESAAKLAKFKYGWSRAYLRGSLSDIRLAQGERFKQM